MRRTQVERSEEARSRVLRAAIEIISERGLDALTLASAGARAGYSRGLPAVHFGDKAGLLAAVTEVVVESVPISLEWGEEGLRTEVAAFFDQSDRALQRCRLAITAAAMTSPEIRSQVRAADEKQAAHFQRHLEAFIETGEASPEMDPQMQAILVMTSMRAALGHWCCNPDIDLDRLKAELLSALGGALR